MKKQSKREKEIKEAVACMIRLAYDSGELESVLPEVTEDDDAFAGQIVEAVIKALVK